MMITINKDYAVATLTLFDALDLYPDLLDNLKLNNEEQTNKFIEMFKSKYNFYEIGGETIPLFKRFIEDTFDTFKDYYQQLINEYEKEFNYLDGYIESYESEYSYKDDSDISRNNDFIDLPNKITTNEYITNKERFSTDFLSNRTGTNKNTKKGNVNILEQKKKYLDYIRNLYSEFADKFKTCFVLVYN